MRVRQQPWWTAVIVVLAAGGLLLATAGTAGSAQTSDQDPHFYVALGGSDSVGLQPALGRPRGQRTDEGYADDLLDTERSRWSDLRLVELGCPGETTTTMLDGGGNCHHGSGSQLADAVVFLHLHPSTALVTVDLGFNNVAHCMRDHTVDEGCVVLALGEVRQQLPQILAELRTAGGPALRIVGLDHYDPFLASYLDGPAGREFAAESLNVVSRLNDTLRAAYAAAGIPLVDVAAAFDMANTEPTLLPGTGFVPSNVEQTCALSWACTSPPLGPNRHPNDAGYRAIGVAISDVLSGS